MQTHIHPSATVSHDDLAASDVELGTIQRTADTGDESSGTLVEPPLPTPPRPSATPPPNENTSGVHPADHGLYAWLFLAGCFVLEGLVWGFAFSFGVFQTYYTTAPPFSNHPKGAVVSVIAFWGFLGYDGRAIVFFTIFYGIFAGGYSAVWAGMMKAIRSKHPEAGIGTMMGLFAAGRGVGSLVSGPLSEVLFKAGKTSTGEIRVYWGNYCFLMLFTAVTALFGGLAALGLWASGERDDEE